MGFEWDERKREANIQSHGVDFVRAAKMFANPVLERVDDREDYGEERLIALGHWEEYFMVTVYTWRGENRRIISAWKAGKDERETYVKAIHG
jgi:uncharacterized DUF497 family protein